jgi:lipoate-protein ligase A
MLYIPNDSLDPRFNLALEEHVLKGLRGDNSYLLLWRNSPSVIIGRFQNTLDEINSEYIKENGVNVVRRITGGGAVYHDLGNLNFSFVEEASGDEIDLRVFSERAAAALIRMSLQVELSGRNDLTIDGRKFSGNAQYRHRRKILHHGTILYDANLNNVQAALNVKADKISSKGVSSVRSRVTNLIDYMPERLSILEFRERLLRELFNGLPVQEYSLSEQDLLAIKKLVEEKYATWEWNYGQSPDYNLKKTGRFPFGGIEVFLKVEHGIIESCRICGDFFTNESIPDLEAGLLGTRYEENELRKAYQRLNVAKYFQGLGIEEFLQLFL